MQEVLQSIYKNKARDEDMYYALWETAPPLLQVHTVFSESWFEFLIPQTIQSSPDNTSNYFKNGRSFSGRQHHQRKND